MNSAELPKIFLPPVNREMRELDRSFFKKTVPISGAVISDSKQTAKVRTALTQSAELLQVPGIKSIVDDESGPGAKCILLKPEVDPNRTEGWSTQLSQLVDQNVVRVRPYELHLGYDNWTMHNILEAILPELPEDQRETPSGFAQAGHIAHLNLREQYLPYRYLIGQVLLDKNGAVKTVINKTLDVGSESAFRTFPYEILAGKNDLEVTLSEQGCEFRFNFAEVYWNSRLGTEHERMVAKFEPGQAVCDVMAGVGPFAIPAGKKGVWVRANDLNPKSFEGLSWAVERNKVTPQVSAACIDGRQFIKDETRKLFNKPRTITRSPPIKLPRHASEAAVKEVEKRRAELAITLVEPLSFDHYVMNLPASAAEFLDAFQGLYHGREKEFVPFTDRKLPIVHVYTFQAKRDTGQLETQEICAKLSNYLGTAVNSSDEDVEVFKVRLVAPNKWMYCASFRLPQEAAFADPPSMTG